MINKSRLTSQLIASSLLLAGITIVAPKANAADFIFDGSVADECSFDQALYDGILTENGTKLESNTITTNINCNKVGQTLTISAPVAGAANPAAADSATATAELTGVNAASLDSSTVNTSASLTNLGNTIIAVSMEADFGTTYPVVPAGDYVYTVTLTLTP